VNSGPLIWDRHYTEGFCVVTRPEGFKEQGLLLKAVTLADKWPDNVVCRMDADYAKDIKLSDNVYGGSYRVVSSRLKDTLVALAGSSNIEFLPVSILNHKGRVASKDYFIMNPLDVIDCIDQEKSGVKWNVINTSAISSCRELVLSEGLIPADSVMFRPKFMLKITLVKREVAVKLLSTDLTGLFFLETSSYKGG
jgi:hypothetical protein